RRLRAGCAESTGGRPSRSQSSQMTASLMRRVFPMIAFDANLLARPWGGLPGCGEKMSGKLPPWAAGWLELPADGRGIALAAGSVGLVAVGLVALANGSLMGWVCVSLG